MYNISEKVIKALEGVNLTQYEISLYLTLIEEGSLNARDLSEKSNVPYSRIYNILSLLLDKGFIIRDDSERPSKFKANPPDEALMVTRKKMLDDFDMHSKIIVQELNDIYLKKVDAPFQVPLIVYRGKDAVFNKAKTMLKNASESILVAINSVQELEDYDIFDIIKENRKKGIVNIKVLIEEESRKNEKNKDILKNLNETAEIRERDQIFGTGIAVDHADALIIIKAEVFGFRAYFGFQSDHEAFAPAAKGYFDYLFNSAKEIKI